MTAKQKPWAMPAWMEPFRKALESLHGGNTVEELMNNHDADMENNCVLAAFCISMINCVGTLGKLKEQGLLVIKE